MKVAWQILKDRQRSAHLVVAALPAEQPFGGSGMRQVLHLLERPIKQQAPSGDHAATIVRDSEYPGLCLAFEREDDARKLAGGLRAQPAADTDGWATRWTVRLEDVPLDALALALPPTPKHRPKDEPAPTSSIMRYPLSRAPNRRGE